MPVHDSRHLPGSFHMQLRHLLRLCSGCSSFEPASRGWIVGICMLSCLALDAFPAFGMTPCVDSGGTGLCDQLNGPVCSVTTHETFTGDTLIDCTGIDVRVEGSSGRISVDGGTLTLIAESIYVDAGRKIDALESSLVPVGLDLQVASTLLVDGRLLARNGGGGSLLLLSSGGDMRLGALTTSGIAVDVSGTAQGVDGGEVIASAGGNMVVQGKIVADGKTGGGEDNVSAGGVVELQSLGSISIERKVRANGHLFDGGLLILAAAADITVIDVSGTNQPKGRLQANGSGLDGGGGEIEIEAGDGVSLLGAVTAMAGVGNSGGEVPGGALFVYAGCGGISASDDIDLSGGEFDGGLLVFDTVGDVALSALIDVSARSRGGFGGNVEILAGGAITLNANTLIHADGHTGTSDEQGPGGIVELSGCSLAVDGATITANGANGGVIDLIGRDPVVATGGYSLKVSSSSTISAVTGSTGTGGQINLIVADENVGGCNNNSNTCFINIDCTEGCTSGLCDQPSANPDIDGVHTQFTPAPVRTQDPLLLACSAACS